MRIRTIKPEFWSHPVMVRQEDATKLLALGLLNYADDFGYFYADAPLVKSALRPFDDDSTMIRRCLDQLEKIGYIERRQHATHGELGLVVSFTAHQRVDRPKASIIKDLYESSNVRRLIGDASPLEGKGKEGNGSPPAPKGDVDAADEVELEKTPPQAPKQEELIPPPPKPNKARAGTLAEVCIYCREVGLTTADAEWVWEKWENQTNWHNGKGKIRDWKSTVRTWKMQLLFPSQRNRPRDYSQTPPAEPKAPAKPLGDLFQEFLAAQGSPRLREDARSWSTYDDLPTGVRDDFAEWRARKR